MDEYRVEHWRSSDGAIIASGRGGQGYPLLHVPPINGSLQYFFTDEEPLRAVRYEGFEHITYDRRGTRMSDRDAANTPVGLYIDDIEAVVNGLGLDRLAVYASFIGVPEAVAFAARNPDRVSHLVLRLPVLSVRDWLAIPRIRALMSVFEEDWEFFVNAFVLAVQGWSANGPERVQGLLARGTPAELRHVIDGLGALDVSEDFASVAASTLVIQQPGWFYPDDYVRRIAAMIPRAETAIIPTSNVFEGVTGMRNVVAAFLSSARAPVEHERSTSGFTTILFTDVVASTPLLTQLRDERMRAVMRDHDAVCEAAIAEHGGRVVKTIGDAFMAEFALPSAAIDAAIAIQRGIRERFAASDVPVRLRIGINAGEPIVEDDDLHGTSVVIAKRLESEAGSDGVLISDVVRQAVAGKDFAFDDRGPVRLDGFDEPVRAWAVRWEG